MSLRYARALPVLLVAALALAPTASAADPDPVEGQPFSRVLATYDPPLPSQLTIDWGDGTTSAGSPVTLPSGQGDVTGSHTYAKHGSYNVAITDNAEVVSQRSTTISVKDAPLTVTGTRFPVGATPGGVVVARVTDGNPLGVAAGLRATIEWGDNGPNGVGTITPVAGQPGAFEVRGAYAYPDGGTYLASVSVESNDGGTAQGSAQSTAEGAPEPPATSTGRILDLGEGGVPSLEVDDAGTAHLVWAKRAPGRLGDAVVYCAIPRGAKGCAFKRTFYVDALYAPLFLRSRVGTLYIVISSNSRAQAGGGTLLMTSEDDGRTWGYRYLRVNTGLFQGGVIDVALSQNGRTLYALFGDFLGALGKDQQLATIGLDRVTLSIEDYPGKTAPRTGDFSIDRKSMYSVRSIGVLPDGRVALAGYDTDEARKRPRAAIRPFADADGNPLSAPWTPIRAGAVSALRGSPRGASALTCTGDTGEVSSVRGLRLGAPRPLGDNSCGADLFIDKSGGRHVLWTSRYDGCQGSKYDTSDRWCLVYRRARPGGDFGPKTTIANLPQAAGARVATAPDGDGWVAWNDQPRGFGLGPDTVKITPTFTSSEAELGSHRIVLAFTPGSECAKRGPVNASVKVSGPADRRPQVQRVTWSTNLGLLPRRKIDTGSPFSVRLTVDRRAFDGRSSTGIWIWTMTVRAKVRYSVGRSVRSATLTQPLSFYCGVKFDRVKAGRR